MWKIVYTVDKEYRNEDNYIAYRTGDPEVISGDTLNETIKNLIEQLKNDGVLESIIDTNAFNLNSYDECLSLEIVSIEEVITSLDPNKFNIFDTPIFSKLVNNRKEEVRIKNQKIEESKKAVEKEKELKELIRLQDKYVC